MLLSMEEDGAKFTMWQKLAYTLSDIARLVKGSFDNCAHIVYTACLTLMDQSIVQEVLV